MEKNRTFEILVGLCVIFAAAWFFFYAYSKTKLDNAEGYTVIAKFDNADGVAPGIDVKISGVKVGAVTNVSIDRVSFMAEVAMKIDKSISLASDTEASITVSGLLGGKYINLSPGIEESKLQDNEEIAKTRGAQNLESLISKFLLSDKK